MTSHGPCLTELSEQLSFTLFFQVFQEFSLHGSFELKWYIKINIMGFKYHISSLKKQNRYPEKYIFHKTLSFSQAFLAWKSNHWKGFSSVSKWECFHKYLLNIHRQSGTPLTHPPPTEWNPCGDCVFHSCYILRSGWALGILGVDLGEWSAVRDQVQLKQVQCWRWPLKRVSPACWAVS